MARRIAFSKLLGHTGSPSGEESQHPPSNLPPGTRPAAVRVRSQHKPDRGVLHQLREKWNYPLSELADDARQWGLDSEAAGYKGSEYQVG